MQVPLDGGFRQVHRLGDIAVGKAGGDIAQDLPLAMANVLIFIESIRVNREPAALLAKALGHALPGARALRLGGAPGVPERQQTERVVLEQAAVTAVPGFFQGVLEQGEGFFAVTSAPIRHRK
ncbi:hypothetical protein D9M68_664770 [compost metagenome]